MPAAHSERRTLGVAEMDDTHDDLMRELATLRRASDEDFPRLFDGFHRRLRAHCDSESRLMRACRFPATAAHEAEHRRVLDDIALIGRGVARRRLGLARAYIAVAMARWLHIHMTGMDDALAACLRSAQADGASDMGHPAHAGAPADSSPLATRG